MTKNPAAEQEQRAPAAGARPAGAGSEQDAAARVREMFSGIAPRYDFLNHTLSLSIDHTWRRRVAKRFRLILERGDGATLDVCCGTGDLALALSGKANGVVIGTDFAHPMLVRAREKVSESQRSSATLRRGITFFEADALSLPLADASFDLVTLAFGFRNLSNYDRGLREFARILKPGGQLGILEFSEPRAGAFAKIYRWYLKRMLPRIGRMISGHDFAYSYLPDSVSRFFTPEELAARMSAAGFKNVTYERWTGGAVTFHTGTI